MAIYCMNCGQQLPDAAKFCRGCGSPVAQEIGGMCGTCGAELGEGSRFCMSCGAAAVASATSARSTTFDGSSTRAAPVAGALPQARENAVAFTQAAKKRLENEFAQALLAGESQRRLARSDNREIAETFLDRLVGCRDLDDVFRLLDDIAQRWPYLRPFYERYRILEPVRDRLEEFERLARSGTVSDETVVEARRLCKSVREAMQQAGAGELTSAELPPYEEAIRILATIEARWEQLKGRAVREPFMALCTKGIQGLLASGGADTETVENVMSYRGLWDWLEPKAVHDFLCCYFKQGEKIEEGTMRWLLDHSQWNEGIMAAVNAKGR